MFEIAGHRYGLPLPDVVQVMPAVTCAPLPAAPDVVEGIINVRGDLVPVFDLRKRFRLPAKPTEATDHLILARAGDRLVAIRADRAVDLCRLDAGQVEDVERVVANADHIAGIAKLPDGLVLIHDLRTFLSEAEATALATVLGRSDAGAPRQ